MTHVKVAINQYTLLASVLDYFGYLPTVYACVPISRVKITATMAVSGNLSPSTGFYDRLTAGQFSCPRGSLPVMHVRYGSQSWSGPEKRVAALHVRDQCGFLPPEENGDGFGGTTDERALACNDCSDFLLMGRLRWIYGTQIYFRRKNKKFDWLFGENFGQFETRGIF